MAEDKPKKPKRTRHTKLVVPGMGKSSGKGSKRPAAPKGTMRPVKDTAPAGPYAGEDNPQDFGPAAAAHGTGEQPADANTGTLPPNAVALPSRKTNPRITAVRRKKRRHRFQALGVLVLILAIVVFIFSGAYRVAVLRGTEWLESARIGLQGGDGYPMDFEVPGFKKALPVGSSAFVVLGEQDMAVVSAKGNELYRIQHGYSDPHITAGGARVCVYNRGGTGYTIEGRDRRIVSRTADQEILFAQMSPGGSLALVTTSRYRATLQVFDYSLDEEQPYTVPLMAVDEMPYSLAFLSDNRHIALACITTQDGAAVSRVQLLHTRRSEVQGTIDLGEAVVLYMDYQSANRLLVVTDKYAATFDAKGTQTARYDYAGRDLYAADTSGGITALVFSSLTHNRLSTVMLDSSLGETGSFGTESADGARVLVAGKNIYLLAGYNVYAHATDGTLLNTLESDALGYGLLALGTKPLLIQAGGVVSLEGMTKPEATNADSGTGTASTPAGAVDSALEGIGDADDPASDLADEPSTPADSQLADDPPQGDPPIDGIAGE